MELITITEIEAKFGKPNAQGVCTPFWAVRLADSRKATVWDENIAKTLLESEDKTFNAEMKISPQGYINIRAINKEAMPLGAPVETVLPATIFGEQKTKPNPQRVGLYIKLAVEMMIAAPQNEMTTEECLCENIQEIKRLEEFTVKLLSE